MTVISSIAMLLGLPSIMRNLGSEEFAIYSIFFTIISQLSILDFGLPKVIIPRILNKEHFLGYLLQIIFIFLLIHAVVFTLVVKFGLLKNIFDGIDVKILLFASFITFSNSVLRSVLEGLNKVTVSVISRNLEVIVQICIFLTLSNYFKLNQTLIFYFLAQIVHSLFLFKIIHSYKSLINLHIIFDNLVLFKIGLFFILVNLLGPLLTNFERYILKENFDLKNLAYYTLTYTVASRIFLASSILQPYVYVLASKLTKSIDVVYKMTKPGIWVLTIFYYLVVYFVLPYWLRDQYHTDIMAFFKIIIIGIYCNTIARIPYDFLVAQSKVRNLTLMHIFETLSIPLGYYIYLELGVFFLILFVSIRYFIECIALFIMSSISKKIIFEFVIEFSFLLLLICVNDFYLVSILCIVFIYSTVKFFKHDYERLSDLFIE